MNDGYQIYAVGKGYLVDLDPWKQRAAFSEDFFDGMLFESWAAAVVAQQFCCHTVFGGTRQVTIHPFDSLVVMGVMS